VSVPAPETAGSRAQAVAFGVLALLGAAVLGTSFGYGILGEEGRVGAGLMPMVTGLLLLLLSAGQLLTRLLRDGRDGQTRETARSSDPGADASPGVDVFGRTETERVRHLWTVVVALPVVVLLVPLVGFLAALGLLVLFVSAVVERRPPLVALLVTAIAVAAGYGIFAEFLDVPLPTGAVGDLLGW
jgi:putative tricarboxylic transport membrane protein